MLFRKTLVPMFVRRRSSSSERGFVVLVRSVLIYVRIKVCLQAFKSVRFVSKYPGSYLLTFA